MDPQKCGLDELGRAQIAGRGERGEGERGEGEWGEREGEGGRESG